MNKKTKLASIVGELDIYEDKLSLCVELHNFEFISNTNPYTDSSTNSSPYIRSTICLRKEIHSVQLTKRNYEHKQPDQKAQDSRKWE